MRALIQRVARASVTIDGEIFSEIERGLLVFIGIEMIDTIEDIDWLVGKIARMRVFDDESGVMNLDVDQVQGDVMVVSQFTLHASTKKGNRPSYIRAAPEAISRPLYEEFTQRMRTSLRREIGTGVFGADMKVELLNDGPVSIWMDSQNRE